MADKYSLNKRCWECISLRSRCLNVVVPRKCEDGTKCWLPSGVDGGATQHQQQGSNTCGPARSLLARPKAVHSISPSSLMRPDHTTRSHGFFLLVLRFAEQLTAHERGAGIRHVPDVSLSPPQFCTYSTQAHPVVSALLVTPLGRRPLYGLV